MIERAAVALEKLMVCGSVSLEHTDDPVVLCRGMCVLAADNQEVGLVSAVVVDCRHCRISTHFLLGTVPPSAIYRLIPVSRIERISGETVWVNLTAEGVEDLPLHQPR